MLPRLLPLVPIVSLLGCGGATLVLKSPIEDRCGATGLRGCPELTDGVLLYVDGDAVGARQKITAAAAQNSPEQLRAFARTLRQLREVPGTESFMGPVLEVAQLLDPHPDGRPGGSPPSAPPGVGRVDQPVEPWGTAPLVPGAVPALGAAPAAAATCKPPADTVLEQIEAGIAAPGIDAGRAPCGSSFGEGAGYCLRVVTGPFVVTDLHAPPGCPNDLFASARSQDVTRWTIPGIASGLGVHGARLPVRAGEALFIGAQASTETKLSADPRCAVTWSGFRP